MISFENVSRMYGDFTAVDNVSFKVSSGEIVGLLGHNGAGKTTIMKILTGFLEPTAGQVTINNHDILNSRKLVQEDIGYLPENCPLYPEMTVIDYLDYSASLQNISKEKRNSLIAEAISQTALHDKAMQSISTLSRGYKQRVGVARAILHKPKILILDEPTNGLDPTQIQQMRSLIKELAKQATVIISTHVLQEVQAVCDRVIIIRNGKMSLDAKLDTLQQQSRLLVTVSSKDDSTASLFNPIDSILKIEELTEAPSPKEKSFALTLHEESDKKQTAATIAQTVHDSGLSLYSLQFESKDLETIFSQTSGQ